MSFLLTHQLGLCWIMKSANPRTLVLAAFLMYAYHGVALPVR